MKLHVNWDTCLHKLSTFVCVCVGGGGVKGSTCTISNLLMCFTIVKIFTVMDKGFFLKCNCAIDACEINML